MLTLYENIKKRREELGLTKVELANRVGYDRSMITKIEQGKVDLTQSKILAFAKALETTPANLLGITSTDEDIKNYLIETFPDIQDEIMKTSARIAAKRCKSLELQVLQQLAELNERDQELVKRFIQSLKEV